MLKMNQTEHSEDPSSMTAAKNAAATDNVQPQTKTNGNGRHKDEHSMLGRLFSMIKGRPDTSLREAIEEFIETASEEDTTDAINAVSLEERTLIANVLTLRDMKVIDVMIPRVDIIAVDIETSQKDLLELLSQQQYSRLPVYRDNLDDIVGTIHIKDILATLAQGQKVLISDLVRDVPIVSPSMPVLDLMLMMREIKKHMVLVVDEFGGIDGLVTVGDVIESIVGEIDDEYDQEDTPQIIDNDDDTMTVDARLHIDDLENHLRISIEEDEEEDIDTVGGLVFFLAGRIPARGEMLTHSNGLVFEVLDADPRRVTRILIRNISKARLAAGDT